MKRIIGIMALATSCAYAGGVTVTLNQDSASKDLVVSIKNNSSVPQPFFDSLHSAFPAFLSCQLARHNPTGPKMLKESDVVSLNASDSQVFTVPVNVSTLEPNTTISVSIPWERLRARLNTATGHLDDLMEFDRVRFILSVAQDSHLMQRVSGTSEYFDFAPPR